MLGFFDNEVIVLTIYMFNFILLKKKDGRGRESMYSQFPDRDTLLELNKI